MRSYLGQVDSMKRYSLLAIAVTTALVVVGLLYFSYGTSSRFTTLGIVNLPVMDDHGQQTVAVLQDASVLQEERKLHDSAGLDELYGNATQSLEAGTRLYSVRNASMSQGSRLLYQQTKYYDGSLGILGSDNPSRQTLSEQQLKRKVKKVYNHRLPTLSPEVVDGVEKFVFFVGYRRSGHSIIGSLMDAHPNVIVAHEFYLFNRIPRFPHLLNSKSFLFNVLYQHSYKATNSHGWRSSSLRKGKQYTLKVDTPWQGKFNASLKVIGDKCGCATVIAYGKGEHKRFLESFNLLSHTINIPIYAIHVVRNPYDMIVTDSLFETGLYTRYMEGKLNRTSVNQYYRKSNFKALREMSEFIVGLARRVDEMINTMNLTVLEIHSADFVRDPKKTMLRICAFLDITCSMDYLQACHEKAYSSSTKRRNIVDWPKDVLTFVEASLKEIPFWRRYSFEGE